MHFYESTIKPAVVLAALFWFMGWAAILADLLVAQDDIGHVGLALIASGVMLQIRGYYLSVIRRIISEHSAVELGRAIGREEAANLRQLR